MKVILHTGAHRCATTSFQEYMRQNAQGLKMQGLGFWGPFRTRNGLFHGIQPGPARVTGRNLAQRARGRLQLQLANCRDSGVHQLLVSDENMMGTIRENLRLGDLYSGVGERMARFSQAFGRTVTDVAVSIRSLDSYWTSALAYAVARGHRVPSPAQLDRLVQAPRSWRDVITDIACALPDARLHVLPFETFGTRPEAQLTALTGVETAPMTHARVRLNGSLCLQDLRASLPASVAARLPQGTGRWRPFDDTQAAHLRETYADDMMWLASGADGTALLVQDPDKLAAGLNPPRYDLTRGRPDDKQRRMAGSG
ncbi:hypothetical protein RA19_05490 [Leisingera sp. ANG-M1]|uniref:hypothetical protein n=1 Tax=Leisingera sp. ANG-M1 TaxID=1577895 RepID=UPI00057CDD74|nr:hypothetical protein [Leisingera sp. ANG-M1]KIC11497.1 hypothetical protein RA19_05490 [Leisingera sp. ANG-M1]